MPSLSSTSRCFSLFLQDEERVNQRFKNAEKNGIVIQASTVDLEELFLHLQNNGVAIVLTDANLLDCQDCKSAVSELGNKIKLFFIPSPPYSGEIIFKNGNNLLRMLLQDNTIVFKFLVS